MNYSVMLRKPLRALVRRFFHGLYYEDGLVARRNMDVFTPRFVEAYAAAVHGCGSDFEMRWRALIACKLFQTVRHLPGDYVECGVGKGMVSQCVLDYCHWNDMRKNAYLYDRFVAADNPDWKSRYASCVDSVRPSFARFVRVQLIVGKVPNTLYKPSSGSVCFLHLDMNHYEPEVAALRFFWPLMDSGGVVLLDDYGWIGHEEQRQEINRLGKYLEFVVVPMPTGQGVIFKA